MILQCTKLLTPQECRNLAPLSDELKRRQAELTQAVSVNFTTRKKYAVVCGPCSADSFAPMSEYLEKLCALAKQCDNLFVVARIYTTKPHSNGQGYLGACFAEDAKQLIDVNNGIIRCRKMMIKAIELGLPVADELLYPELYEYFSDLVSYWFIGARSSEDSLHRGVASSLDVCCGVKNGTDGDIEKVVDSLYAVSNPCTYVYSGEQISTSGCKTSHIVLRGGKNEKGFTSNITAESISKAKLLLQKYGLCDYVMADLSHANSGKVANNQLANAKIVVANPDVNGVMVESYLYGGTSIDEYGISKTDECLSFCDTERLLRYINAEISKR